MKADHVTVKGPYCGVLALAVLYDVSRTPEWWISSKRSWTRSGSSHLDIVGSDDAVPLGMAFFWSGMGRGLMWGTGIGVPECVAECGSADGSG